MRKTLGEAILENQRKSGMTDDEIELYNRALQRLTTVRSNFEYGFIHECKKENINPTIARYRKYLKRQEEELQDYRKNFAKYREPQVSESRE